MQKRKGLPTTLFPLINGCCLLSEVVEATQSLRPLWTPTQPQSNERKRPRERPNGLRTINSLEKHNAIQSSCIGSQGTLNSRVDALFGPPTSYPFASATARRNSSTSGKFGLSFTTRSSCCLANAA